MKLTDKDMLVDAVQGAINIMEANGINMISASVPLAIIKGAPTIEAIPVEWLEAQKSPYTGDVSDIGKGVHNGTIKNLIRKWQKEQEASE